MLVWREKGLLVLVSGMLGGLGVGLISGALESTNMATLLQTGITLIVFGLVSAGINYLFCKYFISKEKRVFVDEQTLQQVEVKDRSALFFIPNRIWTYIYGIFFVGLGLFQLIDYFI